MTRLLARLVAVLVAIACSEATSTTSSPDTVSTDTASPDTDVPNDPDVGNVGDIADSATPDVAAPPDTIVDLEPATHRVLWVGNSFTFFNDLDEIWKSLREAEEIDDSVVSLRATAAGYRWVQHLADATTDGSTAPIREWLVTDAPQWDFVVLQEQSQIPGFPAGNPEHDSSVAAAVSLAALAEATGATPVLFESWGYHAGDPQNGELFADFPTMQDRLDDGFDEIAAALTAKGTAPVRLRAGGAFRVVYDAAVAASEDPLAPGSLFTRLYTDDGRHPSALGSYLTACVLAATLSPSGSVGVDWAPSGVDAADAAALRGAAERAALAPSAKNR